MATLLQEAANAAPNECCGLLLGRRHEARPLIEQAQPAANVAADPRRRFEIDPAALIAAHRAARVGGPAVLGYYHSHPGGAPRPSAADRAEASGDGRIWAIIGVAPGSGLGAGEVKFWRDLPDGFEALPSRVAPG